MTTPISHPAVLPHIPTQKPTSTQGPSQPLTGSKPANQVDAVQLSSAAQAALLESTETAAQTTKEAGSGDVQAQRLLAKETANEHR